MYKTVINTVLSHKKPLCSHDNDNNNAIGFETRLQLITQFVYLIIYVHDRGFLLTETQSLNNRLLLEVGSFVKVVVKAKEVG